MEVSHLKNQIQLVGTALSCPTFSHENHGTTYLWFTLCVPRLSGADDKLNVVISQEQFQQCPITTGAILSIRGQIRSFNNRSGVGSRLVISVLARQIEHSDATPQNNLILTGALCKPPIFRRTPLGRDICDLMVAVNRPYGRTDYLPCIVWGSLAQRCSNYAVGEVIALEGRMQSRTYQKVLGDITEERTAFEISVMNLVEE